jgi:hypothetical protein
MSLAKRQMALTAELVARVRAWSRTPDPAPVRSTCIHGIESFA